jgi:hypothetical protein
MALSRGITVIPVLIDRTDLPRSDALPHDLRPLVLHQAYQIRHEHFRRDVDALIAALTGNPPARPSPQATSWAKRILATLGYGTLTLIAIAILIGDQQTGLAEAISVLCVLSAGMAAFLIGTRRWRALRVRGRPDCFVNRGAQVYPRPLRGGAPYAARQEAYLVYCCSPFAGLPGFRSLIGRLDCCFAGAPHGLAWAALCVGLHPTSNCKEKDCRAGTSTKALYAQSIGRLP